MPIIEQLNISSTINKLLSSIGTSTLSINELMATPETVKAAADLINKYPDRFLLGTDEVAPTDQKKYLKIYYMYAPLFAQLTPEAKQKLTKGNYKRIFDAGRTKVRAWEKAHEEDKPSTPAYTPPSGVPNN